MAGGTRQDSDYGCPKCRYNLKKGCERCRAKDYKPTKDCLLKRAALRTRGRVTTPGTTPSGRGRDTTSIPPASVPSPTAAIPSARNASHGTRVRVDRSAAPPSDMTIRKQRVQLNSTVSPAVRQEAAYSPEYATASEPPETMASAATASKMASTKSQRAPKRQRDPTPEPPLLPRSRRDPVPQRRQNSRHRAQPMSPSEPSEGNPHLPESAPAAAAPQPKAAKQSKAHSKAQPPTTQPRGQSGAFIKAPPAIETLVVSPVTKPPSVTGLVEAPVSVAAPQLPAPPSVLVSPAFSPPLPAEAALAELPDASPSVVPPVESPNDNSLDSRPVRGRQPSRRAISAARDTPGADEKLPLRASRGRKRDASQPPSEQGVANAVGGMTQGVGSLAEVTPAEAQPSSRAKSSRLKRLQLHDHGTQAKYLADLKRYVKERGLELTEGWTVSLVERSSGTQAGGTDKYYHHPTLLVGRAACRSREDVVRLLTGRSSQSRGSTPVVSTGPKKSRAASKLAEATAEEFAAAVAASEGKVHQGKDSLPASAATKSEQQQGGVKQPPPPEPAQQNGSRGGAKQRGGTAPEGNAVAAATAVASNPRAEAMPVGRPPRRAAAVASVALQQQQRQDEEAPSEDDLDGPLQHRSRSGRILKRSVAAQDDAYAASSDEGGQADDSGGDWEARGHWRRNVRVPAAPEVRSRSGRVSRRAAAPVAFSEEDSEEWLEASDSDSGMEGTGRRRGYSSAYDSGMLGNELQMMLRRMVPSQQNAASPQQAQHAQQQQQPAQHSQQQSQPQHAIPPAHDTVHVSVPTTEPDSSRLQEALSEHSGMAVTVSHSQPGSRPESAPSACYAEQPSSEPLLTSAVAGQPEMLGGATEGGNLLPAATSAPTLAEGGTSHPASTAIPTVPAPRFPYGELPAPTQGHAVVPLVAAANQSTDQDGRAGNQCPSLGSGQDARQRDGKVPVAASGVIPAVAMHHAGYSVPLTANSNPDPAGPDLETRSAAVRQLRSPSTDAVAVSSREDKRGDTADVDHCPELPELAEDLATDAMQRIESSEMVQRFQLVRVFVSGDSDVSFEAESDAEDDAHSQEAEPISHSPLAYTAAVHAEQRELRPLPINGAAVSRGNVGSNSAGKVTENSPISTPSGGGTATVPFLTSLTEKMAERREERRVSAASGLPPPDVAGLLNTKPAAVGLSSRVAARPPTVGDPRVSVYEPHVSPYGLIEEQLYDNPWKLLVACILLNKTSASQVRSVIWGLFREWPTPEGMAAGDAVGISAVITPLGFGQKRAAMLKRFSQEYSDVDWKNPEELHGIGKYGADAYYMFCRGEWAAVQPLDKDLLKYKQWLEGTGGEGSGLTRDPIPE